MQERSCFIQAFRSIAWALLLHISGWLENYIKKLITMTMDWSEVLMTDHRFLEVVETSKIQCTPVHWYFGEFFRTRIQFTENCQNWKLSIGFSLGIQCQKIQVFNGRKLGNALHSKIRWRKSADTIRKMRQALIIYSMLYCNGFLTDTLTSNFLWNWFIKSQDSKPIIKNTMSKPHKLDLWHLQGVMKIWVQNTWKR